MKDLKPALIAGLLCPLLMINFVFIVITLGIWDWGGTLIMKAMTGIPLWLVKVNVIGLLIGLAVWGYSLSKEYAYQGAEDRAARRDVRLWAAVVIAAEIIPYLFF
jgi:hypothetical protein